VTGTSFTPGPLADGTYFWRVRAFNDVGVPGKWSAKWKVTVDTVSPVAPLLRKPDHEASLTAVRPTLRWRTVSDAASYEVQLDTDPLFPQAPIAVGKRTSYRPPTPLVTGSTYSWRVRAIDKAGNVSAWSEVRVFYLVAGTTTIETPEPASAPSVLITPIPLQPAPPHKPDDAPATPEPPVMRTPSPGQPPRSPDDPERLLLSQSEIDG
jgi:hypothetical protein